MCPFLSVPPNILQEILFNIADFRLIILIAEMLLRKLTKSLSQLHKQLIFINFENLLLLWYIQSLFTLG